MDAKRCDLCDSVMREGDFGEAAWICINDHCEKHNPNWPLERLNKRIEPIAQEIEILSHFDRGTIKMFEGRWIGDGSVAIELDDGTKFECHYIDGEFISTNGQYLTDEIKQRFLALIACREKIFKIIHEQP